MRRFLDARFTFFLSTSKSQHDAHIPHRVSCYWREVSLRKAQVNLSWKPCSFNTCWFSCMNSCSPFCILTCSSLSASFYCILNCNLTMRQPRWKWQYSNACICRRILRKHVWFEFTYRFLSKIKGFINVSSTTCCQNDSSLCLLELKTLEKKTMCIIHEIKQINVFHHVSVITRSSSVTVTNSLRPLFQTGKHLLE